MNTVEYALEGRPGVFLQCADNEYGNHRRHARFSCVPVLDHQGVNQDDERNRENPPAPHHIAKFRNLIGRKTGAAVLGCFQIDLDKQREIVEAGGNRSS